MDVTIVGTTSGGQEVMLPWAPSESLDCGVMVGFLELGRLEATGVPDGDKVVIATGG